MIRLLKIILTAILTSFFFFPFEFTALPGVNTKMALAVLGLGFLAFEMGKRRKLDFSSELLYLVLFAASVSLAALLSITINQTPDSTYVSYLVSFFVWLSAAFAVCCCIRWTHDRIDVQIVLDYLIAVCLFQCIISLVIDSNPVVARWVNIQTSFGQNVAINTKRLYGIGALLDVAGMRMAAVFTGIAYYLAELKKPLPALRRIVYILAFLSISVIGNMIARTTIIGTAIGFVIIILAFIFRPSMPGENSKSTAILTWVALFGIGITVCVILYNTDPQARKLFRFAFEGFFSLAEKGRWEVSSNERLKTMVVFPETLHTWVIGDGYFVNSRYDPNYLGDATSAGYYMGTDVGYLRFIFYFGIIGLIPMMAVIIYSAIVCMNHFWDDWPLFFMALLVGLIVWAKVSTDLFLYFALFLSAAALQDKSSSE